MQETQKQKPSQRKRPLFAIGVAAVAAVVLLAALFVAQSIFYKSYGAQLDRLKSMVADAAGRFDRGDASESATPAGQIKFYRNLEAEAAYLSGILKQLNDSYPLLLAKSGENGSGIADLKRKLGELKPGLDTFKECVDEDAAIAGSLSSVLPNSNQGGQADEYAALQANSDALEAKITGISFTGALESSRKALADSIIRRGTVIDFLAEGSSAGEALAAILADVQSSPDELLAKANALLQQLDGLQAKASETGVASNGEGGAAAAQMLTERREQVASLIACLPELKVVQQGVQQFNGKLEQGLAQGGKFSAKLAAWMAWVKDFDALQAQLDALQTKYEKLAYKRTLESLGLNDTGKTLSGYAAALNALNGAIQRSASVEKDIEAVLRNKLTMVQKTTKFVALLQTNDGILASLDTVEVPPDLADGLAGFKAACVERDVFLNEYMNYIADKTYANGHASARATYLSECDRYKALAKNYPTGSEDNKFYLGLANDQAAFASQEGAAYSESLKNADAHKKAYEASRAKYLPMLNQ